jgi:hypothetical protein
MLLTEVTTKWQVRLQTDNLCLFVCPQTTNFRLHIEQTVNGFRKIARVSVFWLKWKHVYIYIYIYTEMELTQNGVCFPGSANDNSNRRLLFQKTCSSIEDAH